MDRSLLSKADVVAASRELVCARLLTYEDAAEAAFLRECFLGGSGDLENTTFIFLAADGKTKASRGGRAPNHLFREDTLTQLVAKMKELGKKSEVTRALPVMVDFRRGMVTASCDLLPFVAVVGEKTREALAPVAWSDAFRGRFVYAPAKPEEVGGLKEGIVVYEPEPYGLSGKVLVKAEDDFRKALEAALKAFKVKAKDSHDHMRSGRESGKHWETEIPVTDKGGPPPR